MWWLPLPYHIIAFWSSSLIDFPPLSPLELKDYSINAALFSTTQLLHRRGSLQKEYCTLNWFCLFHLIKKFCICLSLYVELSYFSCFLWANSKYMWLESWHLIFMYLFFHSINFYLNGEGRYMLVLHLKNAMNNCQR